MKKWKASSWRDYPVKHIPSYEDEKDLNIVLNKIKTFPPLVFAGETTHLKNQLADVVDGKAFLLQTSDSCFIRDLDSPANTNGGKRLILFRTRLSSSTSSYLGICLTG